MDEGTAQKYHFTVGDHVRILLSGPPQTFTISGLVKFGTANNLAGATIAAFDLPTAQSLFNEVGQLRRHRRPHQARGGQGQRPARHRPGAPTGVEVVTGQTVANEQTNNINQALGFFSTALLVFAFISLFVGGFTIFNTFSIIVGQRTRELALLRIVGASRRQVFRSVLARGRHPRAGGVAGRPRAGRAGRDRARGAAQGIRHHPPLGTARLRVPHRHRRPRWSASV